MLYHPVDPGTQSTFSFFEKVHGKGAVNGGGGPVKLPMKRNFFIILFERAFKMMKNGVYFIVIALLVAELFKILLYAN